VRWLADECVHATVVSEMRKAGHDVLYTAEIAQRTDDALLAEWAAREGRILLTEDKDFGEIAFLQIRPVGGIVLLRVDPKRRDIKWARLKACIEEFGDGLHDRYVVVDESRIRSRLLSTLLE
jgi:predicted nuclease of predicted toxin-antitoxin system